MVYIELAFYSCNDSMKTNVNYTKERLLE